MIYWTKILSTFLGDANGRTGDQNSEISFESDGIGPRNSSIRAENRGKILKFIVTITNIKF